MESTDRRLRSRRRIVAFAGALVVLAAAVTVGTLLVLRSSADAGPAGAVAYYSVVERGDSRLIRQPLDGLTPASTVAVHRLSLSGSGWWSISPSGDRVVWIQIAVEGGGSTLDVLAPGATEPGRTVRLEGDVQLPLVWSRDGRWLAGQTFEQGPDHNVTRSFVADLPAGTTAIHSDPGTGSAYPVGLADDGALILVEEVTDPSGKPLDWRFSRVDPATGTIRDIAARDAQTDPSQTLARSVNARAGGSVSIESLATEPDADPAGQRIVLREFGSERQIELARVPTSYNGAILVPDGSGVVTTVRGPAGQDGSAPSTTGLVGLSGRASELWSGDFTPVEVQIAPEGDLLGLIGWTQRSRLVFVDMVSGITVELPIASGAGEATLVRLVGGARIAAGNAIVSAPSESPSLPAASQIALPLAGGARVFSVTYETSADGALSAHAAILAPGAGESIVSVDRTPPINVIRGAEEQHVDLVVAPGGGRALLLVSTSQAVQSASIWEPPAAPRRIELPAGWPAQPLPIWRPDGAALATVRDGALIWFELGKPDVHEVRLPVFEAAGSAWYEEPAAWTLDGRRVLLGPSICTEGCPFNYAPYSVLDLESGEAVQHVGDLTLEAIGTGSLADYASVQTGEFPYFRDGQLTLAENYSDVSFARKIAWPAAAGELEPDLGPPVWSDDGRRLWIQARVDGRQHVFRLDGPIPPDPTPTDIGLLPDDWRLEDVDPAERWAIARRAGEVWGLVELATGTVHEMTGNSSAEGFSSQP